MPANNIPPLQRIFHNTKINENGCWVYQGSHNNRGGGYCQFSVNNKHVYIHRFMYEYYYGQICPDLVIDHLCKNSRCVNPKHLEQVTQKENCRRGNVGSNMSQKTHCIRGHKFSPENTYIYTSKMGLKSRNCIICRRISAQKCQKKEKNIGNS